MIIGKSLIILAIIARDTRPAEKNIRESRNICLGIGFEFVRSGKIS